MCSSDLRMEFTLASLSGLFNTTQHRQFRCLLCSEVVKFGSVKALNCHVRQVHKTKFGCEFPCCNKAFGSLTGLKNHRSEHTQTRRFFCDQCSKGFMYESLLQNHKVTHPKEQAFCCADCDCKFKKKGDLDRHVRSHHSGRDWLCLYPECPYVGKEERHLWEHCQGKHREHQYKCKKHGCSFMSSHRSSTAYHLKNTCKVAQQQMECQKAAAKARRDAKKQAENRQ